MLKCSINNILWENNGWWENCYKIRFTNFLLYIIDFMLKNRSICSNTVVEYVKEIIQNWSFDSGSHTRSISMISLIISDFRRIPGKRGNVLVISSRVRCIRKTFGDIYYAGTPRAVSLGAAEGAPGRALAWRHSNLLEATCPRLPPRPPFVPLPAEYVINAVGSDLRCRKTFFRTLKFGLLRWLQNFYFNFIYFLRIQGDFWISFVRIFSRRN